MNRLLPHDYARRAPIEHRCLHLWRCGARTLSHFLDELASEHDIAAEIAAKLDRYCQIDADILIAVGGDRFAPAPTRIVGGER
jgi:hypothetical protein